jgi:hypothetical protein
MKIRSMVTHAHADDDLPVVLLDDKADLAALPTLSFPSVSQGSTADTITPQIIRDLIAFGRTQIENGAATAALTTIEANNANLVAAYHLGWLPPNITAALSRDQRQALNGQRLGNSVIIPAFDDQNIAVDLVIVNPKGGVRLSLFDEPRGLIAPEVLHAADELIVTDTFAWVARLFSAGHRNVLLLRGTLDASANADRIVAAGVRQAVVRTYRSGDAIAEALRAAGIAVTMDRRRVETEAAPVPAVVAPVHVLAAVPAAPAPAAPAPVVDPNALVFVEEEGKDVAIFQAGAVRYSVTMRQDGVTKRRVVIRAHGKSCAHDVDLAVPAARERTAGNAARQVGLPQSTIVSHLVQVLAGVQAREEARLNTPSVAISVDERTTGAAFLADPKLLDRVVEDLGKLGWIGEDRTKQLLYLVGVSRLLQHPLWGVNKSTGGASPWQALACIAALTPPEAITAHHRVTDAALVQSDPAALRHRLLVVDQAETIRPEAAVTLRILKERGGVAIGAAEARGPVAVLAAAAGDVDHRCRDCFMTVMADESPEQTARILAEQRRSLGTAAPSKADLAAIAVRHHAAQRLLERLPVSIPFVERIAFPANSIRHREEQRNFLGIISASALLHQRQRQRSSDGAIVATVADFEIAVHCSAGLLGQESKGISPTSGRMLTALVENKVTTFTMADLGALLPDWGRSSFHAALHDLADFGHIEAGPKSVGGRGKLREYRLISTTSMSTGIRLRPVGSTSYNELASAKLSETVRKSLDSLSPVRTGT